MIPAGVADRRWRSSCPGTPRSTRATAGPTSCPSSSARTSIGSPPASASSVARGPFFYLPVLFSDSFPWSLFSGPGVHRLVERTQRRRRPRAIASGRVRTLLWLWIAVFVGFFSLSAGKQDLYIFPIVPAVCALAGWAIARASRAGAACRRPLAQSARSAALLFIVGARPRLPVRRSAGAAYAIEGVARDRRDRARDRRAGDLVRAGVSASSAACVAACRPASSRCRSSSCLRRFPSFEAYKPVPGSPRPSPARGAGRCRRHLRRRRCRASSTTCGGTSRSCSMSTSWSSLLKSGQAGLRGDVGGGLRRGARRSARAAVRHRPRPTFDVRLKNVLAARPAAAAGAGDEPV